MPSFMHPYGGSEGPHGLRGYRFLAAADRSTSKAGGWVIPVPPTSTGTTHPWRRANYRAGAGGPGRLPGAAATSTIT
jgi:hypothetical protein